MKKLITRTVHARVIAFGILTFVCAITGLAQVDTLHLVYHHTQIKPHDSTLAKIEKWGKKLNGQHVDIQVVGYYHKPEFRKFAQERCDELFLELNRKVRNLITIESIGPKKGKDFQRTTVDIIYKKTITPEEAAAALAKEKEEEAKKKEAEKTAQAAEKEAKEKVAKEKDAKEKEAKELKEKEKKDAAEKKAKDKKEESETKKAEEKPAKDDEKAKEKALKKEKEQEEKAAKEAEKEKEKALKKEKEQQEKEAKEKEKAEKKSKKD